MRQFFQVSSSGLPLDIKPRWCELAGFCYWEIEIMAITKKNLGNRGDIIAKKFREHYADGEGGIRFDAFCMGWKE